MKTSFDMQKKYSSAELLLTEDLREIQSILSRLIKCGAVQRLHPQKVAELLSILSEQMKLAERMKIQQNEDTGGAKFQCIIRALAALALSLQIMASGFTGVQNYREDLIVELVDLLKFHLTQNVYAWFDPTRLHIYKVNADAVNSGEGNDIVAQIPPCELTSGTSKRKNDVTVSHAPPTISQVPLMLSDILSATLLELSKVLRCICLSDAIILQIVDLCISSLAVEEMYLIQLNAVEVVAAAFECYPKHRGCILDRILVTFPKLPGNGRQSRRFMLPHDENLSIQIVTAMLMKCIQGSGPPLANTIAKNVSAATNYAAAFHWSHHFWKQLLIGWQSARAQEIDIKAMLQNTVQDLLTTLNMPEWPVASVILQSLCAQLLSGLGMNSPETKLREFALEILGQIAARLTEDSIACENDEILQMFTDNSTDLQSSPAQCSVIAFRLANEDVAKIREQTDDNIGFEARTTLTRGVDTLVLESMLIWYIYQITEQNSPSCSISLHTVLFYLAQWSRECDKKGTGFRSGLKCPGGSHALYENLLSVLNERNTDYLLGRHGESSILSRADSIRVCRILRQNQPLAQQLDALLRRLVGALEDSAIMVRTAAVRAIAYVVNTKPQLLHSNRMQTAIERRLSDSGTMVRAAIVELLGKHIINDEEVAHKYLPAILERISDVGTSVRKRVINILHKYLSTISDSRYERQILRYLAFRILDDEIAIQELVVRIFRSMWLSDEVPTEAIKFPTAAPSRKNVDERAKQLVEVLWDVYCCVSRTGLAKLPLLATFPIVVILRRAIFSDDEPKNNRISRTGTVSQYHRHSVFKTAERLCRAVLNGFLAHEEQSDNKTISMGRVTYNNIDMTNGLIGKAGLLLFPQSVRYALALHVLCVTDKRLCIPRTDPMEFATTLHPYIKRSENDPFNSVQLQGCISVLDVVIGESKSLTSDFAKEIEKDLRLILLRNAYHGVLHQAAHCICTIARMQPIAHAPSGALQIARRFVSLLHHVHAKEFLSPEEHAHVLRALFVLGQMSRFGADALEASGEDDISPASLLCLFRHFLRRSGGSEFNIKRIALQAWGYIFVSRPRLMLSPDNDFGKASMDRIMCAALSRSSESGIKEQVLQNLAEFFREEENKLLVPTRDKAVQEVYSGKVETEITSKANAPKITPHGDQWLCPNHHGQTQEHDRILLQGRFQIVNGEHESNLSNGVAQRYWPHILQLCVDSDASVRLQALHLVEVVLRQGLVHPMSCFPHLIALQADPTNNIQKLALRMLRHQRSRYPDFFDNQLSAGMQMMFEFCRRLLHAFRRANDDNQTCSDQEVMNDF